MGILRQIAEIIIAENAYKPFTGEILLCGRQTIYMTPEEAINLVKIKGSLRPGVVPRVDQLTREGKAKTGEKLILDESFFELFTDAKYNSVDVSDYESANIIHDMARPVPEELCGRFSFIFNGSVMDNMGNPGQFIQNTSRMLAPGGVIINIEHGSLWKGAYLMFSPDYFFDFYAVNQYADCKTYSFLFDGHFRHNKWNMFRWDPGEQALDISTLGDKGAGVLVLSIAEKGKNSTDDKFPLQAHYRPEEHQQVYAESAVRFRKSARPIFKGGKKVRPVNDCNFTFCGSL